MLYTLACVLLLIYPLVHAPSSMGDDYKVKGGINHLIVYDIIYRRTTLGFRTFQGSIVKILCTVLSM